ncbi:flagellar motor protein MotB, partial [Actinomyces oris]
MRRRVFLSGAILTGVGMPMLAGCKLPWQSKHQAGPASASASAGGASGAAVPAASAVPQGWQELDAHVMGHKVSVEVSPVIRQDKTSYIAVKLTRASDDASIDAVNAHPFSDNNNRVVLSSYLGAPTIFRPGAGADLVKLLDTGSGRVWSAVDGSGGMLELTPGKEIISYLSFGKVDTDTVTVMVPMAGFTTVSVLDANDAKKAKVDLSTAQTEIDKYPRAAPELADPVAIERYARALDDSTSTHAGSKDITVTLASDVTFASDSADLTSAADAQLKTVAGQLGQYPDGGTLTIVGHTDDV